MARREIKDYLSKEILREIWDCGLEEEFKKYGYAKLIKNHRYISGKELGAVLKAIRLVKGLISEEVIAKISPQKRLRFYDWYREVE